MLLAEAYFEKHGLDFLKCHKAYENNEKSELGKHWLAAESEANLALYGFNIQDISMVVLDVDENSL